MIRRTGATHSQREFWKPPEERHHLRLAFAFALPLGWLHLLCLSSLLSLLEALQEAHLDAITIFSPSPSITPSSRDNSKNGNNKQTSLGLNGLSFTSALSRNVIKCLESATTKTLLLAPGAPPLPESLTSHTLPEIPPNKPARSTTPHQPNSHLLAPSGPLPKPLPRHPSLVSQPSPAVRARVSVYQRFAHRLGTG